MMEELQLDYYDELKREWLKEPRPSMMDDIKSFGDLLREITDDKLIELYEKQTYLSNTIKTRNFIRRTKFLRDYTGDKPQQDWDYIYQLSEIGYRKSLSEVLEQIDRFEFIKRYFSEEKKPEIDLEAIKAIPIESLYQGNLRENGGRLLGLCPIHKEKTPSFTIYKKTNSYHCFGCQSSGSVIDFYMNTHNVDVKEAIKSLNNYIQQ